MHIRCPHCRTPIEVVNDETSQDLVCPSCGSSFNLLPQETVSRLSTGHRMLGRFALIDRVGVGAFGEVWTARDSELDRIVAIKMPRKGQLSAEDVEAFLREARAAASLHHPGIVAVHEVGKEDEQLFIVSDFVVGLTLADWLTGKRPTQREAAELCATIADAVQHAHDHGVIHRDLKPSNIMLGENNQPHIMDFGLAKRDAGEITMTIEGRVLGTPAYMSPEQAKGTAHDADARSDVYSLGVILYELLTGELPFRGNPRMLIHQVIYDEPPSPRRLNGALARDLETICLKCMQKDPGKRFQSAQALADDLRRFVAGIPIVSRPVTRFERSWRWIRRNPVVASLGLSVIVLLTVGTIVSAYVAALANFRAEENGRRLYISHMNVAQRAWEDGNVARVKDLLRRYDDANGQTDLRGWEWYYLWGELQRSRERQVIELDEMPVSLALAGDDRDGVLVTGHSGGTINVWQLQQLQPRRRSPIRSVGAWFSTFVCLSPDGKALAFPNQDQSQVILLDLETDSQRELSGYSGFISCAAFSPDGTMLAAAGAGGMVAIWDLASARMVSKCVVSAVGGEMSNHKSLAFSPDSRLLAVGTIEGVIEVWNTVEQRLEPPFKPTPVATLSSASDKKRIVAVDFSPNSALLAAAPADGTVRLWDVSSREERILAGHRRGVNAVAFAPDGRSLASASYDSTIMLWDTTQDTKPRTINGHSDGVADVAFTQEGKTLVSAGLDYSVRFWDMAQHMALNTVARDGRSGQFVFIDETSIASIREGSVCVWELGTSERVPFAPGTPQDVECIARSREGLLGIKTVSAIEVWDIRTRSRRFAVSIPAKINQPEFGARIAFSRDGNVLALEEQGSAVSVWGVNEGILINRFRVEAVIQSLALSSDGGTLAIVGDEKVVRLWDTRRGKQVRALVGPKDTLRCVAFSPDDTLVTAGGFDNVLWIWRWKDNTQPWRELSDAPNSVMACTFSDDGDILLSGDGFGFRMWDVRTWEQRFRFEADCFIYHLAISPKGTVVAGGDPGSPIEIWRFPGKREVDATDW